MAKEKGSIQSCLDQKNHTKKSKEAANKTHRHPESTHMQITWIGRVAHAAKKKKKKYEGKKRIKEIEGIKRNMTQRTVGPRYANYNGKLRGLIQYMARVQLEEHKYT